VSISKMTAGVFGAVYLLVGLLGFVPALGGGSGLESSNLLGLFAVNGVHNVVHIAVGVAGLAAFSQGPRMSTLFAQVVGVTYAILAAAGIFFGSGNFLGLVPIGGLDIVLHAATAAALLYVGFAASRNARPAAA
jgi:hypothetical protein